MSEELKEAVQLLQIGSEFSIKIGHLGLQSLQKLIAVLYSKKMTAAGKLDFNKLQKYCYERGMPIEIVNFHTEDAEKIKEAESALKKMNVQFAQLPDEIKGDGCIQYIVPADQLQYFNAISKKFLNEELEILDGEKYNRYVPDSKHKENLKNLNVEELKKAFPEQTPSKPLSKDEALRVKRFQRREQLSKDPDYILKSINKDRLLVKRDDANFYFWVPGKKRSEVAVIPERDITYEDGKSIEFAINRKSSVLIQDNKGEPLKSYTGGSFARSFNVYALPKSERKRKQGAKQKNVNIKPKRY